MMDASFTLLRVYFLQPHFNLFNSPSRPLTPPKSAFALFAFQFQDQTHPLSASGADVASFLHQRFRYQVSVSLIESEVRDSQPKRRSISSDDPQALTDLPKAISQRVLSSRSPVRPFSTSNVLSSHTITRSSHICSNINCKIAKDPWLLHPTKDKPRISLSSPS